MTDEQLARELVLRERVKRGAALLDRVDEENGAEVGWRQRVDAATLELAHPCKCVLGQLYGEYEAGLAALDGRRAFTETYAKQHGFMASDEDEDGAYQTTQSLIDEFRVLDRLWLEQL